MNELFTSGNQIVSSDRVLYTASSFARSSLLHLLEIGSLEAKRPHTSERSSLQSFLFFIVISGAGTLIYDSREYKLEENSCVFIDCKKSYSHTTDPNNLWTLHWCHFYGPTMSSIYQKYCERGGRPVFSPADSAPFFSVLSKLTSVATSSDYMRDMLINEQLSTLVRLLMSESWHPEDKALPSKRASVLEVKKYLDENYASDLTLDILSSRFYISKHYLSHSFKDQFGMPVNTYLNTVRISHAKQLLRFTDKTIEEVAVSIGLSDPAYFSRLFKSVEGVSPSVFREQW